jgi:hypothetical protein
MSDDRNDQSRAGQSSAAKPTDEWLTGEEPMTGAQRSYLETLAREAGEDPPGPMTKAQASETIERLQRVTGRGAAGDTNAADDDASLAERVEAEGIVDQQAMLLDHDDDGDDARHAEGEPER